MSLESMIPPKHKVRVVNEVIDEMGIDPFLAKYKGGGAGSFILITKIKGSVPISLN